MNNEQVIKILRPQFWHIGKSNGEQLWMHHFTVWHIFKKMTAIGALPAIEIERELLEIACIVHDLKKSTPWNQMIISGQSKIQEIMEVYIKWWESKGVHLQEEEKIRAQKLFQSGRTDHQIETERDLSFFLTPYLKKIESELNFSLTKESIRTIFEIIKHHFLKEQDITDAHLPGFGNHIRLLKICDRLASMESIDYKTINDLRRINYLGRQLFDLSYFTLSRKFGPSNALIADIITDKFKENGWEPLLYFENARLFITKGSGILPDKNKIIEELSLSFKKKALHKIPLEFGTKNLLTGMAGNYPVEFVQAHKDKIIRKLNQIDAGVVFFKFLTEILQNAGYKKTKIRKKYPVLDVLFSLTSGTSGIPSAKRKWKEYKNEWLPFKKGTNSIDRRESLNFIFHSVKIEEIIPEELLKRFPSVPNLPLHKLPSKDLFTILLETAKASGGRPAEDIRIKRYLDEIISVEEEKDFSKIAKRYFQKYKSYKQNPSHNEGICEICCCPVTQKPGSDFARGQIQAFSQIKADPNIPRKICPFCSYDNSVLREGIGNNVIPIYVKIGARIPIPFRNIAIDDLLKHLKDGLIRVQHITNMQKRWGLLFPDVPILEGKTNYDVIEYVATSDKTELIARIETVSAKGFSPKDKSAQYQPLYHILNILGFRASIGTEEQHGLFGEYIMPREQAYYRSLAVILLSYAMEDKKKKGRYLFAQELIEKSPSLAITLIAEGDNNRNKSKRLKLSEELFKEFLGFMSRSDIVLFFTKGGQYTMKELLKDAAFFANKENGIGHFCVEPEKRGDFWRPSNMTKYSTAKPVSDAFNEILAGRDIDYAMERFMRNISSKISAQEQEELSNFVNGAKRIFLKYYKLREEKGISNLIKAKNALISAIYVFTRYQNLKEVCNE